LDRILDTAAALFWKKGYAATTTREIAAAVGIQQASLYHHVAGKEDLLYQICASSLRQFLSEVHSAVNRAAGPRERVRALVQAHLVALLSHQERNATMLTELRALARAHKAEVLDLRERYSAFVRSVLEAGQSGGAIRRDVPSKYLCLALLNMLNWAALWFRPGLALSAQQLAGVFASLYVEGAARGPVPSLPLPEFAGRPRKPPARARRPPDQGTLNRLMDAAVALFSRKGYAATSIREVAALLGIQKASLYYHIQSKEDLLDLVCKSSLEQIRRDVEAAIAGVRDPLERVRTLIRAHVESLARDVAKHSVTLTEMHTLSPARLSQVVALRNAYEDRVRSALQNAQNAGVLRADLSPKYLCLGLLGLMNRVVFWYRRGGPLAPAELGQVLAAVFLTGAAGAAPKPRT
jgi:AcrR family transcriptional regulator